MSNRFLGYAILVPILLGLVTLFTLSFNYEFLKLIDMEVYIAMYIFVTICFLIGLIKLWWIPNRVKQWLPIKNRPFIFVSLGLCCLIALTADLSTGNQLQILAGLFSAMILFTVSFRLITAPTLTEGVESPINYYQELKVLLVSIFGVISVTVFLILSSGNDSVTKNNEYLNATTTNTTSFETVISEKQKIEITKKLLSIYKRLYFITLDNSTEASNVESLISSWQLENINDRKALERLLIEVKVIETYNDPTVDLTKRALIACLSQLILSFTQFEQHLKDLTEDNVDFGSLRYQNNLHQAETKEAFTTLYQGVSLYPFIFIKYGENGERNSLGLSEEGKTELLNEIDRLFGDSFIEHKKWNEETGMNNIVIMIVESLRDFIIDPFEEKN